MIGITDDVNGKSKLQCSIAILLSTNGNKFIVHCSNRTYWEVKVSVWEVLINENTYCI